MAAAKGVSMADILQFKPKPREPNYAGDPTDVSVPKRFQEVAVEPLSGSALETPMKITFLPPCHMRCYQIDWEDPERIINAWNSLPANRLVEAGEITVKMAGDRRDVVLSIVLADRTYYVRVSEIDATLTEHCSWWRGWTGENSLQQDHVLSKIRNHMRMYFRAQLRVT